jgi:hypothetical protein
MRIFARAWNYVLSSLAQERFELAADLFDRIEVRRILQAAGSAKLPTVASGDQPMALRPCDRSLLRDSFAARIDRFIGARQDDERQVPEQ